MNQKYQMLRKKNIGNVLNWKYQMLRKNISNIISQKYQIFRKKKHEKCYELEILDVQKKPLSKCLEKKQKCHNLKILNFQKKKYDKSYDREILDVKKKIRNSIN